MSKSFQHELSMVVAMVGEVPDKGFLWNSSTAATSIPCYDSWVNIHAQLTHIEVNSTTRFRSTNADVLKGLRRKQEELVASLLEVAKTKLDEQFSPCMDQWLCEAATDEEDQGDDMGLLLQGLYKEHAQPDRPRQDRQRGCRGTVAKLHGHCQQHPRGLGEECFVLHHLGARAQSQAHRGADAVARHGLGEGRWWPAGHPRDLRQEVARALVGVNGQGRARELGAARGALHGLRRADRPDPHRCEQDVPLRQVRRRLRHTGGSSSRNT